MWSVYEHPTHAPIISYSGTLSYPYIFSVPGGIRGYTHMTTVITVKVKGDLEDRYLDAKDKLGEEKTKSDLVRELIQAGFRERDVPLFARLDLPNRVAAQMEDDRERGESDEVVIRRFITEAVDAREANVLDAIDAGEDLRDIVKEEQKQGETLDDAVRRLRRIGAEQTTPRRLYRVSSFRTIFASFTFFGLGFLPASLAAYIITSGPGYWLLLILFLSCLLLSAFLAAGNMLASLALTGMLLRPQLARAKEALDERGVSLSRPLSDE